MTLTAADFAEFFNAIHGDPPFPWQQKLVDQLACEDQWPEVLDLPTGAGKTAALDAAVFHLALRADTPQCAALRIILVVDRRLVVDDADRRARKIACALGDPTHVPEAGRAVVEAVAQRLQQLAGNGEQPLVAVRLRGGAPLEHDWVRSPTQPTILCSTVDQVGSRLLFRGYGVSDRMKPVHAGLLGEDSLILLDEAHLSNPFNETLQAIRAIGSAKVTAVVLTATPDRRYERRLELGKPDRTHPVLQPRIEAAKPARLMKPIPSADPAGAFTRAVRELAERLRRGGIAAPAVGVVVNRVDLARAIFERLRTSMEGEVELLIGRSRDVDRRQIEGKLDPFRTGAAERAAAAPLTVVATQCLEVGVDLDLDGLVTQGASLDALRQRFGRLNRAGRPIPAAGAILVTTESVAKKADDPVYGDRIRTTWDALTRIARNDRVDFGVVALDRRLRQAKLDVTKLAAPRDRAPVLMPAYLDLWGADLTAAGRGSGSRAVPARGGTHAGGGLPGVARRHHQRRPVSRRRRRQAQENPGADAPAQRRDGHGADLGSRSVAEALEHGARCRCRRRAGTRERPRGGVERHGPHGVPLGRRRRSAHRAGQLREAAARRRAGGARGLRRLRRVWLGAGGA